MINRTTTSASEIHQLLFGQELPSIPHPGASSNRKLIASDVADEVRAAGGEVINVVSHPDGVLIVGFTKSNTPCQLLICHSNKPPRSLSTSIYVVRSLPELRGHLQSL